MTEYFVVKGELAAWALGLEDNDRLTLDEMREMLAHPRQPAPKRRKRRLGHESYRQPHLRWRELAGR